MSAALKDIDDIAEILCYNINIVAIYQQKRYWPTSTVWPWRHKVVYMEARDAAEVELVQTV